MFESILLISVGVIIIVGGVWQFNNERRDWNKGVCRESGKPWVCFDTDSQGGRGYDDGLGHTIWISYPVDRRHNASAHKEFPNAS